ncbi:MAG: YfcL family protein [Pseudomonadales bacterium]
MPQLAGDTLYQWLLTQEDNDNDDLRFYASYLIGHASLALADAQSDEDFYASMQDNLSSALAVDKLSDADRTGIEKLWQAALQQI